MTKIFKTIAILAASLGMVACSTNEPIDNPTLPEQDGLVEVNLYAENHLDQSRVSITETEESIICAWEATDQIGVFAQNYNGTEYKNSSSRNNLPFTYDATNNYFSGTIPSTSALGWRYTAYYPYSNLNGTNSSALVPFPAERVQYGNEYPCAYDIMSLTAALETTDTEVGKQNGSPIIFNLERRTAIAYFHFTATDSWAATEKVEAITISSDDYLGRANLKYKRDDSSASFDGDRYTSITINYDESNQPYAADFKAYFHLMPGTVENLVITIYTENHTATYTATSKTYEAGKLYRSNLAIASTKWESRIVEALTAPTINEEVVVAYNSATFSWEAVEGAVGYIYKFGEDGEETTVETTYVTLEDLTYSTDYNYTLYVKALGNGVENSDSAWASYTFDFTTGEAPAAGSTTTYTWDFTTYNETTFTANENITSDNGKVLTVYATSDKTVTVDKANSNKNTRFKTGGKGSKATYRCFSFEANGSGTLTISHVSSSNTGTGRNTVIYAGNDTIASVECPTSYGDSATFSTVITITEPTTIHIVPNASINYYNQMVWVENN